MGVQINGDTGNISATKADYSGNVTIGGTLTYEDVTNIDSVGLVTARSGIEIGARPGVAASISVDGNMIVSGISTLGDHLKFDTTGKGIIFGADGGSNRPSIIGNYTSSSNNNMVFNVTGEERVRINSSGDVGIGTDTMNAPLTVVQNDNSGHIASFRQKNVGNSAQILIESPTDNNIRPVSIDLAQAGTIKWSLGQAYAAQSDRAFHIATSALSANDTNAKLTITTAGVVGINSNSPTHNLDIHASGNPYLKLLRSGYNPVYIGNAAGEGVIETTGATFFKTGGSERVRIDSSGRLLIGTGTARAVGGESNPRVHIEGSGATSNSWMNITRFSANNGSANIQFAKSRSNTAGDYTIVQNNDNLGQISFLGADGTDMANYAALIKSQVDGTPGSNDMPGKLVFATTSDGASFPTPRMEISSVGIVTCRNVPSFLVSIGVLSSTGNSAVTLSENNGFTLSATGRNAHNVGSHFNEADGKFTAPVEGLYFFGYSIMRSSTSGSGAVDIRIIKNNNYQSVYSRNYQGAYTANFQAEGNTTIVRLKKDDYIQLRMGANMSIHDDDSYFYGYLIG